MIRCRYGHSSLRRLRLPHGIFPVNATDFGIGSNLLRFLCGDRVKRRRNCGTNVRSNFSSRSRRSYSNLVHVRSRRLRAGARAKHGRNDKVTKGLTDGWVSRWPCQPTPSDQSQNLTSSRSLVAHWFAETLVLSIQKQLECQHLVHVTFAFRPIWRVWPWIQIHVPVYE